MGLVAGTVKSNAEIGDGKSAVVAIDILVELGHWERRIVAFLSLLIQSTTRRAPLGHLVEGGRGKARAGRSGRGGERRGVVGVDGNLRGNEWGTAEPNSRARSGKQSKAKNTHDCVCLFVSLRF